MTLALAIAPIFLLVVIGNVLWRLGLPGDGFWPMAGRLGYWVLIPTLLFHKLSTAEIDPKLMLPFGGVLAVAFFGVGAVILLVTRLDGMQAPQRGSVLQGAVRHNAFIALAVAERLYGAAGLSLAALAASLLALVTNLSIVPALLMLDAPPNSGSMLRQVARDVVRNPFIMAICAGLTVNFLGIGRIPVLHDVTGLLGGVALPLMLLYVGAGLRLDGVRAQLAPMGYAVLGRYLLFPIFVFLLSSGLEPQQQLILMIFACVPTAPSSTALAVQTGGDAPLMNSIVTLQTAAAFLTLPFTLALVGYLQ